MKTITKRAASFLVSIGLVVVTISPASARHVIRYKGDNSQNRRVVLDVLKKDSGRRFLSEVRMKITYTCEDDSVRRTTLIWGGGRLDADGVYELHEESGGSAFDGVAMVRFRGATGTIETSETHDVPGGGTQICSTGLIEWTADRVGVRPARN